MLEIDLLSVTLLLLIILFTFLSIREAPNPDVHPLLLSSQSDATRVRYPGESSIYRSSQGQMFLSSQFKNLKTVPDLFQCGLKLGENFLGARTSNGSYVWQSYNQINIRIANFGSGLIKFANLSPQNHDLFGIFMKNCPEWVIADLAASHYSLITVSFPCIRPFLQNIIDQINLTEITTIMVSLETLPIVFSAVSKCQNLKFVIVAETDIPSDMIEKAESLGLIIKTFNYIEESGSSNRLDFILPTPQDTATVVFTTGTTSGKQQAIELTHSNLVAAVGAFATMPTAHKITSSDVHLSYLPLAYIYERIVVVALTFYGASIAFYNGEISKMFQDAQDVKPTIFTSVPQFLNKFHETTMQVYGKKLWFEKAIKSKLESLKKGRLITNSFWDYLVFKDIKAQFGGRVRLIICATGPISQFTLDFCRITLGCQVIQAYGSSECSGPVTANQFFDYQPVLGGSGSESHVGPPLSCNEIKLVDIEEQGYTAEDQPNPRGEVCVRGPNVMKGYYKDPDKTAQMIDHDRWFHTGDIGMMLPNGTLRILSRKMEPINL